MIEEEIKKENALMNDKLRDGVEIINDLKDKIEKMKCCGNCKNFYNIKNQDASNRPCDNWELMD